MSYTTLPDPSPHMLRMQFSPQRKRPAHGRTESEFIPRPLSIMSMSPSKRSSVYVSEASTLLSHRNSVVSPVGRSPYDSLFSPASDPSTLLSPEPTEFVDHYAILELGPEATVDEIKAAFRRLRVAYFQSDATKYRALTQAMELLADGEARAEYDDIWRAHNGVSAPVTPYSSLPAGLESPKHGRKDSGHSAGSLQEDEIPEEEEEELMEYNEEPRNHDPNWALKRHHRVFANYRPYYGTEPYDSFVPVLTAYETYSRHPRLRCRRPSYVGDGLAQNAMPF
ncbi:uncharacterized protein M421DRAFT_60898 [Didymella exigua CBS 183.55]|uniref:J domain-containing protein n=1 Tax=Didymella exigua CBS 183.55 TaxID=1150837 RepID=A0A6A5RLH9_9PLEO|nr:uncharacterized protein M421DRAFT_60898 [Didymella exigua CBS 183.55]KAF1929275.1 hypothetical protein M421DRAFT_60898 [Didymella exigua CBS 183.55]